MAALPIQALCSKADCTVGTTGTCAEGHDPLQSCPNYGSGVSTSTTEVDPDTDEYGSEPEAAEEVRVALSPGETLTAEDVHRFLQWRDAAMIAVVGDSFSGKTTLGCAIYDRFLKGPFAGLEFVGSWSLVALERRSHYARAESGRTTPETPRTSIHDGVGYFHFALADNQDAARGRIDFLISDRAGEVYKRARGNSTLIPTLVEVIQADRVMLLLDGSRVADPVERVGAMHSVRQTLRAFLDNGAIGLQTIVQVVTTKYDVVAAHTDSRALLDILKDFQSRLEHDFGRRLSELTFWNIAARDPNGAFAPAHGVDALIRDWVQPRKVNPLNSLPKLPLVSEFDRLLTRTPLAATL